MRFRTTVELGGKTATGLRVPPEVVEGLASGKRAPVRVTVNGHTYRSTVAPRGGVFMLPLAAEHRAAAGVQAGDAVDVDLELDDEPRTVEVPPDLQAALDANPLAAQAFSSMSYSHQLQHVLAVRGAKAAETRQRRIDKAITMLETGAR